MARTIICSYCGEFKKHEAQQLCRACYMRSRRNGTWKRKQEKAAEGKPLQFLIDNVNYESDECLIWPYGKFAEGYGCIRLSNGSYHAHRKMLELTAGPPPSPDMLTIHLPVVCHNRACVSPRHLRWGTVTDNARDKLLDGTSSRKLSDNQVREILALKGQGYPCWQVAEWYYAIRQTIGDIWCGRRYRHLQ